MKKIAGMIFILNSIVFSKGYETRLEVDMSLSKVNNCSEKKIIKTIFDIKSNFNIAKDLIKEYKDSSIMYIKREGTSIPFDGYSISIKTIDSSDGMLKLRPISINYYYTEKNTSKMLTKQQALSNIAKYHYEGPVFVKKNKINNIMSNCDNRSKDALLLEAKIVPANYKNHPKGSKK
jgi:ATP-dependent helicase YprA (DUF1998 family)